MPRIIDPIAEFMKEHDAALHQLSMLNSAVKSLSTNGFSERDFKKVLHALSYMNREVSDHNHKEEEALFPILERYVEGPTRVMREDHILLAEKFVKFRDAVSRVKKKPSEEKELRSLATITRSIVKIFVNHIHKENYILFPMVQRFLTKEELREVAKKMK
jgi:hemerythrin-like domain-containing protein